MSTDLNSKKLNIKKLDDSDYFDRNEEFLEGSINIEEDLSLLVYSNNNRRGCKFSEMRNPDQSNTTNQFLKTSDKDTKLNSLKLSEEKVTANNLIKIERNKFLSIRENFNKTKEDPLFIQRNDFTKWGPSASHIVCQKANQYNNNSQIPQKNNSSNSSSDDLRINIISENSILNEDQNEKYKPYFFNKNSSMKSFIEKLNTIELVKNNLSEETLPKSQRNLINLPSNAIHSFKSGCAEI